MTMREGLKGAFFLAGALLLCSCGQGPEIERMGESSVGDWPAAVRYTGNDLIFSGQVFPDTSASGVESQLASAIDVLLDRLKKAGVGSAEESLLQLSIYTENEAVASTVHAADLGGLAACALPAVSVLVLPSGVEGALLSLDAVARGSAEVAGASSEVSILRGPAVYFSGQVGQGELLEGARQATREQLERVDRLGLERADIKRARVYLRPIERSAEVLEVIREEFGSDALPPLTVVEWDHAVPFELELTVEGTPNADEMEGKSGRSVAHLNPDWMDAYPVYCRMAWVGDGPIVFFSSLVSRVDGDGEVQVRDVFAQLSELMEMADTEFDHLVRARYVATSRDVRKALGAVRKENYDPERAAASTLLSAQSIGVADRSFLMEVFAAPGVK